jgi:hypothetical protein
MDGKMQLNTVFLLRRRSSWKMGFIRRIRQMDNKPCKTIFVSRPTDQSLEAYKAWMRELAQKLQKNGEVTLCDYNGETTPSNNLEYMAEEKMACLRIQMVR